MSLIVNLLSYDFINNYAMNCFILINIYYSTIVLIYQLYNIILNINELNNSITVINKLKNSVSELIKYIVIYMHTLHKL